MIFFFFGYIKIVLKTLGINFGFLVGNHCVDAWILITVQEQMGSSHKSNFSGGEVPFLLFLYAFYIFSPSPA